MGTMKPQAKPQRSARRRSADVWAPKMATAAKYRKAAARLVLKSHEYVLMAEALETEANEIREQSA